MAPWVGVLFVGDQGDWCNYLLGREDFFADGGVFTKSPVDDARYDGIDQGKKPFRPADPNIGFVLFNRIDDLTGNVTWIVFG